MPKMTPAQRAAANKARAQGLDDDAIDDAIADAGPTEDELPTAPTEDGKSEVVDRLTSPAPKAKPANSKPLLTAVERRPARSATPTASAASLFTSLDDVEEFVNALYWGREGSGKTTDALSAANLGKVLVINAEGGLKRTALQKRGINIENVFVYPPPGESVTFEGVQAALTQVRADLLDDPKSWFAVILDSVTEVSTEMVSNVSDDRITKARNRGQTIDLFDSFFVDRGDYGTSGKMMRSILRMMRDLQCHAIFTALERRDVDEDTSKVAYGPAVPPGLQSDLLGYVDLVFYTREPDEDKPVFRAATKRAGRFRAKDRFDSMPTVLAEPTFERVIGYLHEEISEASDPLQALLVVEEKKPAAKSAPRTTRRSAAADA